MIGILLVFAALGAEGAPDGLSLIEKNENTLARIHTMRLSVEGRRSVDEGETWSQMYEYTARRSGTRERTHTKSYGVVRDDQWVAERTELDFGYTERETRALSGLALGYRPRTPLEGRDVDRIKGGIQAPTAQGPQGRNVLWSRSLLIVPEGRYSLRGLYAASPSRKVQPSAVDAGRRTWTLFLNAPDGHFFYEITFAPDRE